MDRSNLCIRQGTVLAAPMHTMIASLMEPTNASGHAHAADPTAPRGCNAPALMKTGAIGKPKVLVAVANHGTKNKPFLDKLLAEYRSMDRHEVKIVVLSNIPKDLGPDVEVKVGLPCRDPWSLPFGYKTLFAERAEEYDLFIYTEDDTLITEKNLDAFAEVTRVLPGDFVAGFLRYEVSPEGRRFYPDMHSHFHWDPNSVMRFGNSLFASYTNEHAACFILTQVQLRRAIDSGGFMLPPRRGRYDMLVTAATEPYTSCGTQKLICISRIGDFCLHHLPNAYCGILGLDMEVGMSDINRLESYASESSKISRGPLFEHHPLRDSDGWNKKYYENRRDDIIKLVPRDARRVLSVGCGCGTTEAELVKRGIEVVGIPLDAIIGALAGTKGIAMLSPDFELAAKELDGQQFDCILMMDILQLLRDPVAIMRQYCVFLRDGGTVLVSVPNWNYLGILRQRLSTRGRASFECRATARSAGVHRTTKARVTGWLRQGGLSRVTHAAEAEPRLERIQKWTLGLADELLCRNLLISARRQ